MRQRSNAHNTYTNNVDNVSHINKALDITSDGHRSIHVHAGKVAFKDIRADITTFECNVYIKAVTAIQLEDRTVIQSQAIILGPNYDFNGQFGEEISTLRGTFSTASLAIWTEA